MPNFFNKAKSLINTGISKSGFSLHDNNGNALNIPINRQTPTGIYRTYLPSNNVTGVMTKINTGEQGDYPMGFTPEHYYYLSGTQSINEKTGLPIEMGDRKTGAIPSGNNTGLNKIFRTDISYSPVGANPLDGKPGYAMISYPTNIPGGIFGTGGNENRYGDNVIVGGFTNPFLYIMHKDVVNPVTGLPAEFGTYPNDIKPNFNKNSSFLINTSPKKMLEGNGSSFVGAKEAYDLFDNSAQYYFAHNFDTQMDIPDSGFTDPSLFKNVHLASYIPNRDNEDPTMFGYDISINFNSSPLFNGSIIEFINKFTDSSEIEARRDIWMTFCKQFFKFFKLDEKQRVNDYTREKFNSDWGITPTGERPTKGSATASSDAFVSSEKIKTYYLKKIDGLENLVEKDNSITSDTIKTMIDYGKDKIKLSLYEDVSSNTGYLSMLYKTLAWSRKNGKQVIPENLLRFDVTITITEIRDYNLVMKNGDNLSVFADKLTKYTYTLYDCQFMFNEMPHGNEIDMSAPKQVDSFDITFTYKYSTLSFDKFSQLYLGGSQSTPIKISIDNKKEDVSKPDPKTPNKANLKVYNQYLSDKNQQNVYFGKNYPPSQITDLKNAYDQKTVESAKNKFEDFIGSKNGVLNKAKMDSFNKNLLKDLGKGLKRAAINEVNRQITTQAKLLNTTLDNIRNSIGIGRMSFPTNVYSIDELKYGNKGKGHDTSGSINTTEISNDLRNSLKNFLGQSVRGFFDGNI